MKQGRTPFIISLVAIVLTCCTAYYNALSNGFVYDDIPQVVQNPWIRDLSYLPSVFSENVWAFAGTATNYYRPLMHLSYLITYQLCGLNPWGYHLVNIAFHAGVSVLVFLATLRLLRRLRPASPPADLALSLMAALLFATHPIHTEVVAWVGGITDLSFTFFCLLSLYFFIRSDEADLPSRGYNLLAAGFFFLATLCKEPAVTFPAILAAYDHAFNGKRYGLRAYVQRYAPFIVVMAAYFVLRITALGAFSPVSRHGELTAGQNIVNIFPLFAAYLQKLVFPANLNAWYVFHPITSLAEPRGMVSLIVTLFFIGSLVIAAKKNAFVFIALSLIMVPLLPTLYIPAMGENPFAERYLYLPSVGFVMLEAYLLFRIASLLPRGRAVVVGIGLVTVVLYTTGALARNPIWRDDYTFWSDVVKKSPDGPVPHYNLGTVLAARGRLDEAIGQYTLAIGLKPAAVAYKSLGAAYAAKGLREKAVEEYLHALQLEPDDASIHNELGTLYGDMGTVDKAIEQFETAVRLQPNFANARYNLAMAYQEKGLVREAIEQLEAAVRLNPADPGISRMLNQVERENSRPKQ